MKPQRQTVRAGALDRTLEEFNAEIGYKVAGMFDGYHVSLVAPLEARLAALEARVKTLETPRWERVLGWLWGTERVG